MMSNANLINSLNSDFSMNFLGKSSFSNGDFTHNGSSSISLSDGSISYIVDAWYKYAVFTNYTVRYVNGSGTSIIADKTGNGIAGETITEDASEITGYTLSTDSPQSLLLQETDNVITFVYSPITYIITYNNLGIGGTNDNPAQYNIETPTFTLKYPTLPGYTFSGWDTTEITIETGSSGDLIFTASWTPITYNITYNNLGSGGTNNNPAQYNIETPTFALQDPTRPGYHFNGWDREDITVDIGSTGDLIFTASWTPITYIITYNNLGIGSTNDNPTQYNVETPTFTLKDPTRPGYDFGGWDQDDIIIERGSSGPLTFTALWSAKTYQINYILNGGENPQGNPEFYTFESAEIVLKTPTRAGYNFTGWTPTGTIATGSEGDKTFTANWSEPIKYNITYNLNGGYLLRPNPSAYTVTSPTITLRDPVRAGYNFAGWTPTNTIPSGSTGDKAFAATWTLKTYSITYFMQGGTNNPANPATFTVESPAITFATPTKAGYEFWFWLPSGVPSGTVINWATIAFWKGPINYSISYNLDGGVNAPSNPSTYNVNSATITLADPTRDGYTFAGWSPSGSIPSGSTGNQTFTAKWTPVPYSISYDLAGGVNAATNPTGYNIETPTFTLSDPTRDYYEFAGWTPADTTIEQGSKGNLSFRASWTAVPYSIEYNLAGGVNDAANPANYTVETATFSLANPTRAGYNFTGWDPADTTIEKGSHGDLAFTATWSAPIVYNITYALGGGTNALTNPATYTVESAAITLAPATRAGYDFLAWTPGNTIPTGSTGDRTITATWSAPIIYGITYVMNGGANAGANPATYTVESATINLAAPARAGYNFTGWTPAGTIPAGSTGARTFTATWSAPIVYDITYVMNGGVNAPANPATYTVVSGLITLAAPTRVGYDFVRWTPTDNIPAASTGARTFTATWSQPHVHTVTYIVTGGTQAGLDGATPFAVYRDVAYGEPVPVPDDPSQDEFSFDGWATAIPATMPDEDVTLYGSLTRLPVLQEIITNEKTPLAGPTWSLLNLILTVLTAFGIGSVISMLQKKRNHKSTTKNTAFSLSSLLPAAGAILAFVLTQIMSGSMVFADRWSYLFAGITLVQTAVVALALTGKTKKV